MLSNTCAHRLTRVVALSLVIPAVSVVFETTSSAASVTPASVLASSRSAIEAQSSAHVVFTAHAKSTSTSESIVADVSNSGGSETVSEGSSTVSIRVTPTFAYVSGNSSGLTKLLGMSPASAKKAGKHWVSSKAKTSQYRSLKSDLTMSSVTALLPKAAGTSLSTRTISGLKVYVLKWTTPAADSVPKLSNTLTISASGSSLPLTRTSTASGGTMVSTQLSGWNEEVVVQPPPAGDVVTSSKIGA
jgi:hypothetical protein